MKIIKEFELSGSLIEIPVSFGWEFLCCKVINDKIIMVIIDNPDDLVHSIEVEISAKGERVPSYFRHLDSVVLNDVIWNVFRRA